MTKRVALTAGVFLGTVAAAVFLALRHPPGRAPTNPVIDSPSHEQLSSPLATDSAPAAAVTIDEVAAEAIEPSTEELSATVKHMISDALAKRYRDKYVAPLVANGPAPSDSANIVEEMFNGLTACYFEATQLQYEEYGVSTEDFVRGAHEIWNSTPSGYRWVSVELIASYAPECFADVSQQAGVTIEIDVHRLAKAPAPDSDFGIMAQPNLLAQRDRAVDQVVFNDSFGPMEQGIFAHVVRFPDVSLTDLRIKCEERGCMVLMRGQDIEIYQFEFDRFAEENGFLSAGLGGDASRRIVMLRK